MPCLRAKTFEDNWCPFHGLLSTFAQTKIPTKMDSKNPNSRAFEGLCSNYPQFQKYLKQYIETIQYAINTIECVAKEPSHIIYAQKMPRLGIEPRTQGFSVPCSTN